MILPPHSDGINLSLAELMYYQRQSVRWLPPALSIWSQLSGQHLSHRKGRGMDFAEVRPYQQGDDIRAIDWRVTARTGKPHTKLFTEERECPVMLVVDLSTSMQFGSTLLYKSVQAAHMASLICWLTVANKDRIGSIVIGEHSLTECKPTARQQGPLSIINAMRQQQAFSVERATLRSASEDKTPAPLFTQTLSQLHQLCPKGSDIIVLSDFSQLNSHNERQFKQLSQHNRLTLVNIFDPLEQGDTAYRGQSWLSDLTQTLQVSFGMKSTRDALKFSFEQHCEHLAQLARSLRAPLFSVSAGDTLLSQLGGKDAN
ncbi:DUF58 domain-containing protein [Thaumasiovibrio subtropicus]|uniref:DUF58 domain-containing protein n=1 Tax=Thaumasiovibrio subtropicus TaxID=1891207 RepID=UPI000B356DB9|nr:DUF58 domain-containing protein [Thaumasiovibrio subtropicus]